MKINHIKQHIKQQLQVDLIDIDIELVICHVLNINRAQLFIYDNEITETQEKQIISHLKSIEQGMPIAYIFGVKEFWKHEFIVNEHTLVPRPETELIIEKVLELTSTDFTGSILDLGTGSGAIALSLASERKQAKVIATDFSEQCLIVAGNNKIKNNINNTRLIKSNWFENIEPQKFDFIVSNPPYVAENDPHLNDLKFEPITALTSTNNGMQDIKTIIKDAKNYLHNASYIIIEHGYNQAKLVFDEFSKNNYSEIELIKDLAGLPRITMAKFQNVAIDK